MGGAESLRYTRCDEGRTTEPMTRHRRARRLLLLLVPGIVAGCYGSSAGDDDVQDVADAQDAADTTDVRDDAGGGDADAPDEGHDAVDAPGDDGGDDGATPEVCPGYVRPYAYPPGSGEDCIDSADCVIGSTFCLLPGVVLCGMCPTPTRLCATDPDCPPDHICVEVPPPCPYCPGGPGTQCIPRCTADSCGDADRCDAVTGRCVAIPCAETYACPPNFHCGAAGGDEHGCGPLTCDYFADCDCGVCARHTCISGWGVCSGPVA